MEALIAGLLISFISKSLFFVIDVIQININLLPTDPLRGLLDINSVSIFALRKLVCSS